MWMIQIIYYKFSHHLYTFTSFLFLAFPSAPTTFPSTFTCQQSILQTLFNHSCVHLSNQNRKLFFLLLEVSLVLMLFILLHSCCSEQFFLYSHTSPPVRHTDADTDTADTDTESISHLRSHYPTGCPVSGWSRGDRAPADQAQYLNIGRGRGTPCN